MVSKFGAKLRGQRKKKKNAKGKSFILFRVMSQPQRQRNSGRVATEPKPKKSSRVGKFESNT